MGGTCYNHAYSGGYALGYCRQALTSMGEGTGETDLAADPSLS